jgi:hypothetical protein
MAAPALTADSELKSLTRDRFCSLEVPYSGTSAERQSSSEEIQPAHTSDFLIKKTACSLIGLWQQF